MNKTATITQQLPFYYTIVVWGDEYVDMLLNVALKCFISPNNLPNLTNLNVSKFIFVTTQKDYARISQAKIYKKLINYIEPIFIELDLSVEENRYCNMTRGYQLATELASKANSYAIYLLPDGIISDGTFTSLERYAKEGRDVVLLPGPRVIKEKFMSLVNKMHLKEDDALLLEPRKLVAMGLSCFHAEFKNYNYTGKRFTKWPHMVSWNVPGQNGLLIRAFHLHPIMVNCANREETIIFNKFDTIDANFIQKNFLNLNKFLWEQDSDNMILYSMTEEKDRLDFDLVYNIKDKLRAIIGISQSHLVNALQKIHFYNAYKLHQHELRIEWIKIERESLAVADTVLKNTYKAKNKIILYSRKCVSLLLPIKTKVYLRKKYLKLKEVIYRR